MPLRTSSMSAPARSATFASSFMKLILVASIAFAAYLVSSAERMLMTITRSWLRLNGSYSARSSSAVRGLSVPMHDAVGLHEVLDRGALLQELRIRDDVEVDCAAALGQGVLHLGAHQIGRADRDRRLVHDDAIIGQVLADRACDREHVRQVGGAVLVGRRADRDELEKAVRDARRDVGRELEAPGFAALVDESGRGPARRSVSRRT